MKTASTIKTKMTDVTQEEHRYSDFAAGRPSEVEAMLHNGEWVVGTITCPRGFANETSQEIHGADNLDAAKKLMRRAYTAEPGDHYSARYMTTAEQSRYLMRG